MRQHILRYLAIAMAVATVTSVEAEDIDIFTSGLGGSASTPNILVVFDNTANWAKQSQQWPARKVCPDLTTYIEDAAERPVGYFSASVCAEIKEQQGQAEAAALKQALAIVEPFAAQGFNLGIMEFTTEGNANLDGGYIRAHMTQYVGDAAQGHRDLVEASLRQIHAEVNEPIEKRNANTAYGNLMYDVYNYLKGQNQSFNGDGTPKDGSYTSLVDGSSIQYADRDGYQSETLTTFRSPLDAGDVCADTFVIFVSNPNQSGPTTDSTSNSSALKALYDGAAPAALAGDGSGQGLQMPQYIELSDKELEIPIIGTSNACFKTVKKCTEAINGLSGESGAVAEECPVGGACQCVAADTKCQGNSGSTYTVGIPQNSIVRADGQFIDGIQFNMDDWAKFLYEQGIELNADVDGDGEVDDVAAKVKTFTLDVYNALPDATHSSLMASAAEAGGGYRLQAGSYDELLQRFVAIFSDILAVNTSFAAVSLPLSATNRTQSENKVFIGMFRPAQDRLPRWYGNLKRYQLGLRETGPYLADANLGEAINPLTGFADACAESFWTESTTAETNGSDTSYFAGLNSFSPVPLGECPSSAESPYSDLPDGAFVEKGGVAQQIRLKQHYNDGGASRRIYKLSGTTLESIYQSTLDCSSIPENDEDKISCYATGQLPGLLQGTTQTEAMPSSGLAATVHGDVVHSTPLAVTYGSTDQGTSIRMFYGSNDGLYRAVDPDTGREDWAIIASDQYDDVLRLFENKPKVKFTNDDAVLVGSTTEPKTYFLDGNTGLYTEYNNSNQLAVGYIFPTMRRGGRLLYGLDISPEPDALGTPPSEPTPLWQAGCTDTTTCFDGAGPESAVSAMGQTWSTPVITKVNGYNDPVLLMGGGWDPCLDNDEAQLSNACPSTSSYTGNAVFAFNARTGDLINSWATDYPVVASMASADLIGDDGVADAAYALDVGGSVYRLSFVTAFGDTLTGVASESAWQFAKIAEASASDNLRFMNTPAIAPVPNSGKNYVILAFGAGDREKPLKTNYPYGDGITYKFFTLIDRVYSWDLPNDAPDGGALGLGATDRIIDLDTLAPNPSGKTFGMFQVTESSSLAYPDNMTNYDGWVFSLSTPGEQIVNPAAISGGKVFFNSYNPDPATDVAACESALGLAKGYAVPLFQPSYDSGRDIDAPGLPIPPIIATVLLDPEASRGGDECEVSATEDCADENTVTVCIGCEGFNPLEVLPDPDASIREAYRAENIDVQ